VLLLNPIIKLTNKGEKL